LVTDVLPRPVYVKQPARKFYQYWKADWAKLKQALDNTTRKLRQQCEDGMGV